MPVLRAAPAAARSGIYGWLVDHEEAGYSAWRTSVHGLAGGSYPRQRILDALRAGQPVPSLVVSLPVWARPAGYPSPPRSRADETEEHWRRRVETVTVHPDDRVTPGGDVLAVYMDL